MRKVNAFKSVSLIFIQLLIVFNSFGQGSVYEVFALKFEGPHSKDPASSVAVGATTKDTIESSSIIWVLKGNNGRMVLVDAGYTDTAMIKLYFSTINYIRPDSVLKKINLKPEDITDIIVTHSYLDHIGGINLFPNAMLWMQKDDFNYFVHTAC